MSNDCPVDLSKMKSLDSIKGDSVRDTNLLRQMATDALDFLYAQTWCQHLDRGYLAFGIGGVVAVFFFELTPRVEEAEPFLWVIVGDLPPAYIVVDDNLTPLDALDAYCSEMENWVQAVEKGKSVDGLIPVNAPATPQYAEQLKGRLQFLRSKILPMAIPRENRQ